jgi:hypothetical protein
MPLFSPYHKFYFSAGFVVVPPPTDPYLPASGKLLLEFHPQTNWSSDTSAQIGNSFTETSGCFNFNARGTNLGCDSNSSDCDWMFTGLRYNFATGVEDKVTFQNLSTPACPAMKDCTLVPVTFDNTFKNLTSIIIDGTVAGVKRNWWIDSIDLSWYDNSCLKGLCRENQK